MGTLDINVKVYKFGTTKSSTFNRLLLHFIHAVSHVICGDSDRGCDLFLDKCLCYFWFCVSATPFILGIRTEKSYQALAGTVADCI